VKSVTRSAIVAHSAARLYALVEDVEAYPRFLPWCLAAQVHERAPGATLATLTVGMRGLRQSLTTRNENRPGEAIDMRMVEGPFRHFAASWRFRPLGDAAAKIEFEIAYEFASRSLARLLEPVFERIADTIVDAFKKRADEIYGGGDG
jgi:ribosome-associated toxin RatA of RatAB toxin-antitoxin module